MSKFKYSDEELQINKALKMNQDTSKTMLNGNNMAGIRKDADSNIGVSLELLRSLGKNDSIEKLKINIEKRNKDRKLEHRPEIEAWDLIVEDANKYSPNEVFLEDIMTEKEIKDAFFELKGINKEFSKKTSLINKTDLSFLAIAIALQVTKSLVFPYVAEKFDYGKAFDKNSRLAHDDKLIERDHRKSNDNFRDKYKEKHGTGYWINMLYQTPPYDITKGSVDLGINMGGPYHRLFTLGHDPILGWIFGTMNILTDVITLNNFNSYRVIRKPKMIITPEVVPMGIIIKESYDCIKADYLNLPAAIFAQAQHLKSDKFTKLGLPVPILETINEYFASTLYKSNYDSLCLARDMKVVGESFVVSKLFDIIITLVHGLFRGKDESKDLYEVRTRKILLISNLIASTSTIINATITKNPKNLDIGSLLNTVIHLFSDIKFITKIKKEFIENEISNRLEAEVREIDNMFCNI